MQNIVSNLYWQSKDKSQSFLPIQVASYSFFNVIDIVALIGFDPRILIVVILVASATSQIPALLAPEIVEERQNRIKDFLRVSGLSNSIYWLVNLTIHLALLLVVFAMGVIANVTVLHIEIFRDADAALASTLLLLMFYPVILLFAYSLSYLFEKKETARSVLPYITLLAS